MLSAFNFQTGYRSFQSRKSWCLQNLKQQQRNGAKISNSTKTTIALHQTNFKRVVRACNAELQRQTAGPSLVCTFLYELTSCVCFRDRLFEVTASRVQTSVDNNYKAAHHKEKQR